MLFSPDARESRILGREGKAAGIRFADKSRAIRSLSIQNNRCFFGKIS
jgi:hypothetical protein